MNVHGRIAVVFGVCCLVGCGGKKGPSVEELTKQAVMRVFLADREFSKARDAAAKGKPTPSQGAAILNNYCSDLERLDMSDCPADFRVAYRQHIRAWREFAAMLRQLPDGLIDGVLIGAINGLTGELDGGARRMSDSVNRAARDVRQTWEEVEKIGAKYGAAL